MHWLRPYKFYDSIDSAMKKTCAITKKSSIVGGGYSNRTRATKFNPTGKVRKYPNLQKKRIFVPELNEHYHSIYGAIQESMHIYINSGLKACRKNPINLLEMGFGTGLNALLTFYASEAEGTYVNYNAIEKYPLEKEIYEKYEW